jgi:hypothetical protein
MCGIASERSIKDLTRSTVKIESSGKTAQTPSEAFDQLERIAASSLAKFLRQYGVLSERGFKASNDLTVLRNAHALARGKAPHVSKRPMDLADPRHGQGNGGVLTVVISMHGDRSIEADGARPDLGSGSGSAKAWHRPWLGPGVGR